MQRQRTQNIVNEKVVKGMIKALSEGLISNKTKYAIVKKLCTPHNVLILQYVGPTQKIPSLKDLAQMMDQSIDHYLFASAQVVSMGSDAPSPKCCDEMQCAKRDRVDDEEKNMTGILLEMNSWADKREYRFQQKLGFNIQL
jgi:hypothetical protein